MTAHAPMRPTPRIQDARRHDELRERLQSRAEQRLLIALVLTLVLFSLLGVRVARLALSEAEINPGGAGVKVMTVRRDVVDRHGTVLATNLPTRSLYADRSAFFDPRQAARGLAALFPDMDATDLERRFSDRRKSTIFLKDELSVAQQDAVRSIGEPGLKLGHRDIRLYPNGAVAAHVVGAVRDGLKDHAGAEIKGTAGVEAWFDAELTAPAKADLPLRLSLDLRLQVIVEEVLGNGMAWSGAIGAGAVLMEVDTGEVLALASLPDFDPNARPVAPDPEKAADHPLFNRAAQGVYELGSIMKTLTYAWALENGAITPETIMDTRSPLVVPGAKLTDAGRHRPRMSAEDMLVESSNVGTGRLAIAQGPAFMEGMLDAFGLLDPTGLNLPEARRAKGRLPEKWREVGLATVSYGHGFSTSLMHMATAYGTIANGGRAVRPTLLAGGGDGLGDRVVSEQTAAHVLRALQRVVDDEAGTANFGHIPGYAIGGKTGTARKVNPDGPGYLDGVYLSSFVSVFPIDDPKYVLAVMLDSPEIIALGKRRFEAGWTAVPVAAEITRRMLPVVGLRPSIEPGGGLALTAAGN